MPLGSLGNVGDLVFEGGLSREHSWSLLSWEGSTMASLPVSVLGSGPVELWAAREGCSEDFQGWRLLGSEEVSQGDCG
jgi:hypothetical protein